jgi:hypothetical protein
MNILSNQSGHWTDDQLIASLYGVGPEDGHLGDCAECQLRLSAMHSRRSIFTDDVDNSLLVSQRRRIYARLTSPAQRVRQPSLVRWATIAASFAILSGSIALHQRHEQQCRLNRMLSDAQLSQDVGNMSGGAEIQPAEPLEELFKK